MHQLNLVFLSEQDLILTKTGSVTKGEEVTTTSWPFLSGPGAEGLD